MCLDQYLRLPSCGGNSRDPNHSGWHGVTALLATELHLLEEDAVFAEHAVGCIALVGLSSPEEQLCHLGHAVALAAV